MSQGFTGFYPLPWSVGNGGTGQTTLTAHTVLVGAGTGPVTQVGPGTAGQFLVSGGPSADPTFRVLASSDIPWATPGTIGSTTPNTGAFTTLSATGNLTVSGTGTIGNGTITTSTTTGDLQVVNGLGVGGRIMSTSHTLAQLATPATPTGTAVGSGGTLAAGTNFAKIIAIDGNGFQTGPSVESASVTTVLNGSINWVWTAVPGAQSYQIWVSTTTGTEANYFTSMSNAFTQTAPPASGTAGTIPAVNSTGTMIGAGPAKFGNGTASTSPTTGDFVVVGGAGIGGSINAGSDTASHVLRGQTSFQKGTSYALLRIAGGSNELVQYGPSTSNTTSTQLGQGGCNTSLGAFINFFNTGVIQFCCNITNTISVSFDSSGNFNLVTGTKVQFNGTQVLTTQQTGMGATLAAATAAATYGTNEQTMLQNVYNKMVSLETRLKTHGLVAT